MKVKLGNIRFILEGLNELSVQKLPIKYQYWINKTIPKLEKEFREIEKSRYDLCMKHCKKNEKLEPITKEENGQKVYVMADHVKFNEELFELWNIEIDVKFDPIPIDQLEGVKVDRETILKLGEFITGVEE